MKFSKLELERTNELLRACQTDPELMAYWFDKMDAENPIMSNLVRSLAMSLAPCEPLVRLLIETRMIELLIVIEEHDNRTVMPTVAELTWSDPRNK